MVEGDDSIYRSKLLFTRSKDIRVVVESVESSWNDD